MNNQSDDDLKVKSVSAPKFASFSTVSPSRRESDARKSSSKASVDAPKERRSTSRSRRTSYSSSEDYSRAKKKKKKKKKKNHSSSSTSRKRKRSRSPSPRKRSKKSVVLDEDNPFSIDKRSDKSSIDFGGLAQSDVPEFSRKSSAKLVLGVDKKVALRAIGGRYEVVRVQDVGAFLREEQRRRSAWRKDRYFDTKAIAALNAENNDENANDSDDENEKRMTLEERLAERTRDFNAHLQENPYDVEKWLDYVAFQDEFAQIGAGGAKQSRAGVIAQQKIAILEKALALNEDRLSTANSVMSGAFEELLLAYLRVGEQVWAWDALNNLWNRVLDESAADNVVLWRQYVRFCHSNFAAFDIMAIRNVFRSAMRSVSSVRVPMADKTARRHFEMATLTLFVHYTSMEMQAGFAERAIACYQALLEFNCFMPDALLTRDQSVQVEAFESFWESEAPRIGDEGANSWSDYFEGKVGARTPHVSIADACLSNGKSDAQESVEWRTSRLRLLEHDGSPMRIDATAVDVDADVGDLDENRVVLFDDVRGALFRIRTPAVLYEALCQFVVLLGFHGLPERRAAVHAFDGDRDEERDDVQNLLRNVALVDSRRERDAHADDMDDALRRWTRRIERDGADGRVDVRWHPFEWTNVAAPLACGERVARCLRTMSLLLSDVSSTALDAETRLDIQCARAVFTAAHRIDEPIDVRESTSAAAVIVARANALAGRQRAEEARRELLACELEAHAPHSLESVQIRLALALLSWSSFCDAFASECAQVPVVTEPLAVDAATRENEHVNAMLTQLLALVDISLQGASLSRLQLMRATASFEKLIGRFDEEAAVGAAVLHRFHLVEAFVLFSYLTRGLDVCESMLRKYRDSFSARHIHHERLWLLHVRLVYENSTFYRCAPSSVRAVLVEALAVHPSNRTLLALMVRYEYERHASARLRRFFDEHCAAHANSAVVWLFALRSEMMRPVIGNEHSVRARFEKALSDKNGFESTTRYSILLWRLYVAFEAECARRLLEEGEHDVEKNASLSDGEVRSDDEVNEEARDHASMWRRRATARVRRVYHRAVRNVPWSLRMWCVALGPLMRELNIDDASLEEESIRALVEQKRLRL